MLSNPVMVVGAAVVPMMGVIQNRFVGFLGSIKLWDIAGALPLVLRKGLSVTVICGEEIREVTNRVEERTYYLDPSSKRRWFLRSDLLVCPVDAELRLRASFQEDVGGPSSR